MATINYENKEALNVNPTIPNKNKVVDSDMNLIKQVGNQILTTMGVYTDNWTSSATYNVDEIAIYDNRIFKNLTGTNTATTPDEDTTNWEETTLASMSGGGGVTGDTLPIGSIMPYGSATAPINWLVCDGSAVSRTTYAELFSAIGTSFGSGDGSTTFNLPNLKGKVAVGIDSNDTDFNTIGETGGSKELQEHNHVLGKSAGAGSQTDWAYTVSSVSNAGTVSTQNAGTGNAGNLQPYQVVCYIIKAKQSAGLIANVSNTYSTSQTDTYSCNYVNNKITGTELWTNTSLGGAFGPQTIQVDLSPYKYVELVYYRYPAATTPMFRIFAKVGDVSQLNYCDYDSGSVRAWIREFEVKSTGIEFKIATINGTTNNRGLVPGKIIGHK